MIEILWEYVVRPEAISRFQEAYGPEGDWADLFRRYPGYLGTKLLQDTESSQHFLTIDQWEGEDQFNEMYRGSEQEYAHLDSLFGEYTISERKLGVFRSTS